MLQVVLVFCEVTSGIRLLIGLQVVHCRTSFVVSSGAGQLIVASGREPVTSDAWR